MLILLAILIAVAIVLLLVLLMRQQNNATHWERIERAVREEISQNRGEQTQNLSTFSSSMLNQLTALTQMNEQKLEKLREAIEGKLQAIQNDNSKQLERMRETVDEKLHATLEKRLGESFKVVSDRLEKVHQGLGEMQTLAAGVGDLKKVLSNVKTRGIWGEVQLGNLLEQILTPEQYERNVITKPGTKDPVDFAIKLPGNDGHPVYMPIDAKFPTGDYERLQNAQEAGHLELIETAGKALENQLKHEAKTIRDKYLEPPLTTDFAILFLPTESLYAEVLRRAGLADHLRREFRVIVSGPTTIAALLNSLQMGFRTLAVEKRASEVWGLLGAVKTEFGRFGDLLEKTKDKLDQASKNIDDAARKSRTIERKLRDVQDIPNAGTIAQTPLEAVDEIGQI